jgi:hypothetical protein
MDMNENVKKSIEEYQCSGCTCGSNTSCFVARDYGCGCSKHSAGTFVMPMVGKVFLGMPKGFNRLGSFGEMKPYIFENFDNSGWGDYDTFNVPVWKYLSKEGHTFVRGLQPRKNEPFIHIFLENCMDKINCLEITEEVREVMD